MRLQEQKLMLTHPRTAPPKGLNVIKMDGEEIKIVLISI